MNRRSEKLDKYLNKRVQITFHDGDVKTGVLKFGKPLLDMYSITNDNGTDLVFRKSHVKSIKGGNE